MNLCLQNFDSKQVILFLNFFDIFSLIKKLWSMLNLVHLRSAALNSRYSTHQRFWDITFYDG